MKSVAGYSEADRKTRTTNPTRKLFQDAWDTLPRPLALFDQDLTILLAVGSDLAEGDIDPQKLTGIKVHANVPPEVGSREALATSTRASQGQSEKREISRNGHLFDVHFTSATDNANNILSRIVLTQDITDRKKPRKR